MMRPVTISLYQKMYTFHIKAALKTYFLRRNAFRNISLNFFEANTKSATIDRFIYNKEPNAEQKKD